MLPPEQRPKITIEDLIRLKRAERPAPEFWVGFERELRQKQLTALLKKRQWWQELPQFFARRAYLPVGATAILAFTLVSVRYYAPVQLTQMDGTSTPGSTVAVNHPVAPVAVAPRSVPVTSPLVNRSQETVTTAEVDNAAVARAAAVASPPSARTQDTVSAAMVPAAALETPSSRSFATNLDRLEKTDPDLVKAFIGSRLSAPARVQTASADLPELTSFPTGGSKRSRLLAQYSDRQLNPEPTAPELVRERLSRRLGDSEITDRISRIGLKGDQVSLGLTLRL